MCDVRNEHSLLLIQKPTTGPDSQPVPVYITEPNHMLLSHF